MQVIQTFPGVFERGGLDEVFLDVTEHWYVYSWLVPNHCRIRVRLRSGPTLQRSAGCPRQWQHIGSRLDGPGARCRGDG
jgi:hypothetical protein